MNLNWKEKVSVGNTQPTINLIGQGTVITGDVSSDGDIRIDGIVKGTVNTKAKLVLGPNGVIEGEIFCGLADISGLVKGNLHSKDTLHLKSKSKLNGDMIVGKLIVDAGAEFSGNCTMTGLVKDIKHDKPTGSTGTEEEIQKTA